MWGRAAPSRQGRHISTSLRRGRGDVQVRVHAHAAARCLVGEEGSAFGRGELTGDALLGEGEERRRFSQSVQASQIRMVPSKSRVATRLPSGVNATLLTASGWSSMICRGCAYSYLVPQASPSHAPRRYMQSQQR
jgi:hypothetical protein